MPALRSFATPVHDRASLQLLLLPALYGAAFVLLHEAAASWATPYFYGLLIAVTIVGLLFGRRIASISALLAAAIVVAQSAESIGQLNDIAAPLQLAAAAAVAFLAGSYSDKQKQFLRQVRARDRMLFQNERLKSLRAMSVAVIHELSQPLSTLSLETRYLARLSHSPAANDDEIREVSSLIARKTENLSTMVRRLRSFGQSDDRAASAIPVEALVRGVVELIAAEAKAANVRFEMRLAAGLAVQGQQIELQQALANLLRNALAASPGGRIELVAERARHMVSIAVANRPTPAATSRGGMGLGKLIVEAIATMHGGSLEENIAEDGTWRMTLRLPPASAAA